jgi:Ca2+-binding RTX toxin-like protein
LGDDIYYVNSTTDITTESLNAGNDTINSIVTRVLGNYLENLTLGGSSAINGTGNTLANTLIGNDAANTLDGGSGNDILNGKSGNDVLTGGTGSDTFVFDKTLNTANLDVITDFNTTDDTINLDDAIFSRLATGILSRNNFVAGSGVVALDNDDFLIYDTANGKLYYDADANGAGTQVGIVTLTGIPALTEADFVVV